MKALLNFLTPKQNTNNEDDFEYTGLTKRVLGYAIDFALLLPIRAVAISTLYASLMRDRIVEIHKKYTYMFSEAGLANDAPEVQEFITQSGIIEYLTSFIFLAALLYVTIGCFYFNAMHRSSWQTTIGGRIFGFKTVTQDDEKIGIFRGYMRYFVSIVPWFLACSFVIKMMLAQFTAQDMTVLAESSKDYLVFLVILMITWYDLALFNRKNLTVYDLLFKTAVVNGREEKGFPKWNMPGLGKGSIFSLAKSMLTEAKKAKAERQKDSKKSAKKSE